MPRLKLKLTNKHLSQVRIVEESENAPFIISRGSRTVKGYKYIPPKHCKSKENQTLEVETEGEKEEIYYQVRLQEGHHGGDH